MHRVPPAAEIFNRDGHILKANQAHERITGLPTSEIQGRSMDELVKSGVYSRSIVDEVMREGRPVTIVEKKHFLYDKNNNHGN